MDGEGNRSVRLTLLDEMLQFIEVLGILIDRIRASQMTEEQRAALVHWETTLPALRESLKVLYTSHFAGGGIPAPPKESPK